MLNLPYTSYRFCTQIAESTLSKQDTAIGRYCVYMKEIRYRIHVIDEVLSELKKGGALSGYRESDIELVYLQFRHCLELIMFSALSAHYAYGYDLSRKFLNKEYNATKLLKFIKTKNPEFYPRPVEPRDSIGPDGIKETVAITEGFLTQEDFCKLYDRLCGKMLHAQRKPKFRSNHTQLIAEAVYYRDRMIKLLNCHWVQLTKDISFSVIMKTSNDGEVAVTVMKKIGSVERKIRQ